MEPAVSRAARCGGGALHMRVSTASVCQLARSLSYRPRYTHALRQVSVRYDVTHVLNGTQLIAPAVGIARVLRIQLYHSGGLALATRKLMQTESVEFAINPG